MLKLKYQIFLGGTKMVDTLILDIKQAMSSTLTNGQMEKLHKVLAHYLYDLEIIKKEDKVYTELNKISEDIIEVLNGNEYVIA